MKILIVYLEKEKKYAYDLKKKLDKTGQEVRAIHRKKLKTILKNGKINFDLTITVGGDGTFLRTSHFIDKTMIMGINPRPNKREAFLSSMTLSEFKPEILKKLKAEKLPRLKIKINNKRIKEEAVNDIYVGDKRPYKTSKYELSYKNKKEVQISSGVIVSTAIGTNSWYKSITGKTHKDKSRIYFAVREPYSNRVYKSKIRQGSLKKFKLKVLKDAILVVDSVSEEYKLKEGDKVEVELSKNFLKRLIKK